MQVKEKNKAYLINVLFVLNLDISFLLNERIYYKDLYEYFDKNNIQMRNK